MAGRVGVGWRAGWGGVAGRVGWMSLIGDSKAGNVSPPAAAMGIADQATAWFAGLAIPMAAQRGAGDRLRRGWAGMGWLQRTFIQSKGYV